MTNKHQFNFFLIKSLPAILVAFFCIFGSAAPINAITLNNDSCTNHASQRCFGNWIFWYDSCNNQQDVYKACSSNEVCQNKACVDQDTCTNHSYRGCYNNEVYWFDSCDRRQEFSNTCNSNQICLTGNCITTMTQNQGSLQVAKSVRNLSSGNLAYASSTIASPGDVVQFGVVIKASGNQTINNIAIRDVLPPNLAYFGNLTVDGIASPSNITTGLNLGSMSQGQTKTFTYQARVAPAQNFSLDVSTLTSIITTTSTNSNSATASASVIVSKSNILTPTLISTGWLKGSFLTDSFFVPLILIIFTVWAIKSAAVNPSLVTGWINNRKNSLQRKLKNGISRIKNK